MAIRPAFFWACAVEIQRWRGFYTGNSGESIHEFAFASEKH
jgi:hypothetical protein